MKASKRVTFEERHRGGKSMYEVCIWGESMPRGANENGSGLIWHVWRPARKLMWLKKNECFLRLANIIEYLVCVGYFSKYFANIKSCSSRNSPV